MAASSLSNSSAGPKSGEAVTLDGETHAPNAPRLSVETVDPLLGGDAC